MITPDVARARPVQNAAQRQAQPDPEADETDGAEASFADLVEAAPAEAAAATAETPADGTEESADPAAAPALAPDVPPLPTIAGPALPQGDDVPDATTPIAGAAALPAAAPPPAAAPQGALRDAAAAEAEVEPAPEAEPAAEAKDARPAATAAAAPAAAGAAEARSAVASLLLVDAPRADAPGWRLAAAAASAGRHAAPHAAASPRDVAGQITLGVAQAREGQVEIRLDPPELGRVQIRLHATETGGLQAVVLADRPETQDFLRRHAETLVRDLTEAGYAEVSLEFAAGGDAPERDRPPEAAVALAYGQEPAAGAPAAPARSAATAAGLDIRL
ncbi:flagellar hook-length control protein FliK [Amaricoccus sp.]|uniref:flagellar hook-length control protein FliK n=1 Tax=Amaricoccus sp. TaxID=1872485 RepID=UPI001B4E49E5|nr:flagellar hook-length control protein FliK [Amaricoccus sp.]MBP7003066.1 flagellar hook-length control protein FliK [Amaricoccus sp.]